jgi:predicted regulator of amino acid metabolism with ACT domain
LESSVDWRSEQVNKRLGSVAIVAAAAITLGLSVHNDTQFTASVTTPGVIAESTANVRQEQCIRRAIMAAVPKGAKVYVITPDFVPTQRLSELSTLWAVPEANIAAAQWRLTLVSASGHCDGEELKATRL